jgi:2-amino-4-hydroxy-6-hydroxymethyldihydropteridine diphosphokinase
MYSKNLERHDTEPMHQRLEAFIGLGSNLGNREENLRRALRLLKERMTLIKVSSIYESEPMYVKGQPWFLNAVAKFETNLEPLALLEFLQGVEKRLGREKTMKYGPRSIDLDILFYGDQKMKIDNILEIPHPLIQERRFVLLPLSEIDPDYKHPTLWSTIGALLGNLKSNEQVEKRSYF